MKYTLMLLIAFSFSSVMTQAEARSRDVCQKAVSKSLNAAGKTRKKKCLRPMQHAARVIHNYWRKCNKAHEQKKLCKAVSKRHQEACKQHRNANALCKKRASCRQNVKRKHDACLRAAKTSHKICGNQNKRKYLMYKCRTQGAWYNKIKRFSSDRRCLNIIKKAAYTCMRKLKR